MKYHLLKHIVCSGIFLAAMAAALSLTGCTSGTLQGAGGETDSGKKTGSAGDVREYGRTDFVMDTVFQAKIYGKEDLTGDLQVMLKDLEEKELSWRLAGSEIARVNRDSSEGGKQSRISRAFSGWTEKSLELAEKSGGAFDPTIGMLTRLWNIEGESPSVPPAAEIADALAQGGYEKVHLDEKALTLKMDDGCTLDFGATGKGIGCDQAAAFLDRHGDAAGAVVSIGGSNLVYGSKPDGGAWKVAIQDPRGPEGEYMGYVSLRGTNYISTSGDYEKYFEQDGKRYHHILDPHTGYPARSGLISVTIICDSGLLSDGLSTACFVLGKERALKLLALYGAEGILVDENRNIVMTEGVRDSYTPMDSAYKIKGQ